jgi:hypothetical protein
MPIIFNLSTKNFSGFYLFPSFCVQRVARKHIYMDVSYLLTWIGAGRICFVRLSPRWEIKDPYTHMHIAPSFMLAWLLMYLGGTMVFLSPCFLYKFISWGLILCSLTAYARTQWHKFNISGSSLNSHSAFFRFQNGHTSLY